MTVLLNNQSIVQPSMLTEKPLQIQTDTFSIAGKMQRNRIGQKKMALLEWDDISPEQYQALYNIFTTGSGFSYYNNQSKFAGGVLTFSGMADFDDSEYVPGSSLYSKIKATIREI